MTSDSKSTKTRENDHPESFTPGTFADTDAALVLPLDVGRLMGDMIDGGYLDEGEAALPIPIERAVVMPFPGSTKPASGRYQKARNPDGHTWELVDTHTGRTAAHYPRESDADAVADALNLEFPPLNAYGRGLPPSGKGQEDDHSGGEAPEEKAPAPTASEEEGGAVPTPPSSPWLAELETESTRLGLHGLSRKVKREMDAQKALARPIERDLAPLLGVMVIASATCMAWAAWVLVGVVMRGW